MTFLPNPSRLLKESWDSASSLARELYLMATSGEPAKLDVPLEIRQQKDQSGLRLTSGPLRQGSPELTVLNVIREAAASEARETFSAPKTIQSPSPRHAAAKSDIPEATARESSAPSFATNAGIAFSTATEDLSNRVVGGLLSVAVTDRLASHPSLATGPAPGSQRTEPQEEISVRHAVAKDELDTPVQSIIQPVSFNSSRLDDPVDRGTSRPGATPFGRNIRRIPTPSSGPLPYVAPQFSTDGQVAFTGNQPVQFDTPPLVWNPKTIRFESIVKQDYMHLPWTSWITRPCVLTSDVPAMSYPVSGLPRPQSGTGTLLEYNGNAITNPGDDDVDIFNAGPLPAFSGEYVTVHQMFGQWFLHPAQPLASLAIATAGVSAMVSTTPGSGVVTLVQFNGTSLSTTSTAVTAYSLSSTATPSSTYVGLIAVGRYVWVDYEACPP